MTAPTEPLVTAAAVAEYLQSTVADEPGIDAVVAAVTDVVTEIHGAPAAGAQWRAKYQLGAIMLAARLVRRRITPAGVIQGIGEMGGATAYVQRVDPDAAFHLELGNYRKPRVG